ncbi:MAG: substrate-binding domain-containing protein [Methylorubrum populi]
MRTRPLKLGLLVSREGPLGIWAPSCDASALLAVAELNAAGGLLGQPIELVVADAGPTHASAAEGAATLIDLDGVAAIVTMVESSARRVLLNRIGGRIPVVYTPQFEGGETDATALTIGETTAGLVARGLEWLMCHKRATRFYLIGSDYLWPRRSILLARLQIAARGGSVIGESIVPYGHENYERVVETIGRARPDVVIFWLAGHESIMFNRTFAARGLGSKILRFCTAVEETILYATGPDCTENLFVASSYFANLRSRNNDAFLERYHQAFGASPPPANGFGQSLYEGVHCLSGLAEAAGSLRPAELRRRVGQAAQHRTARGNEPRIAAGRTSHPVHVAVADECDFRILTD